MKTPTSPSIRSITSTEDKVVRSVDDLKYSTPPTGSSTFSWLKRDLEQKADTSWVEAKLEAVRVKDEETKRIALLANEKASTPHECSQKYSMEKLGAEVSGWGKWLRGLLVSAIGFTVMVGSGWLYQYFTLTDKVEDTQKAISSIEETVDAISTSQKDLRISLESQTKRKEDFQKNQLDDMKLLLTQVVKTFNSASRVREPKGDK
jgi:hypothetical protein